MFLAISSLFKADQLQTDADGRRRDLIRQAEAAAGRELGGRTLPLPSSDALPSENYNEVKVGGERRRRRGGWRSQVIRYANEAPVSRDVRIADLKRLATCRERKRERGRGHFETV